MKGKGAAAGASPPPYIGMYQAKKRYFFASKFPQGVLCPPEGYFFILVKNFYLFFVGCTERYIREGGDGLLWKEVRPG